MSVNQISGQGINPRVEQQRDFTNKTTDIAREFLSQVQAQPAVSNKPVSKTDMEDIVNNMNKILESSHTALKFELHEELQEYYVTIVDDVTQEVVKEIPSKKMLDIYAAMTEFVGLVVDKKI
ncbi:flagellar protein FlaG [Bacillus sp. PS06]|uniref:flagellar protein FlaG n=1 Tax=Bacillus sp. PS06 TaxID=2764176 RepID=UPI001783B19D|nr:flagellar protein FlaG [Bacillus sp. PS06]MBD8071403.1 flagellar protein FlaG [Bacillus sp. PS06]